MSKFFNKKFVVSSVAALAALYSFSIGSNQTSYAREVEIASPVVESVNSKKQENDAANNLQKDLNVNMNYVNEILNDPETQSLTQSFFELTKGQTEELQKNSEKIMKKIADSDISELKIKNFLGDIEKQKEFEKLLKINYENESLKKGVENVSNIISKLDQKSQNNLNDVENDDILHAGKNLEKLSNKVNSIKDELNNSGIKVPANSVDSENVSKILDKDLSEKERIDNLKSGLQNLKDTYAVVDNTIQDINFEELKAGIKAYLNSCLNQEDYIKNADGTVAGTVAISKVGFTTKEDLFAINCGYRDDDLFNKVNVGEKLELELVDEATNEVVLSNPVILYKLDKKFVEALEALNDKYNNKLFSKNKDENKTTNSTDETNASTKDSSVFKSLEKKKLEFKQPNVMFIAIGFIDLDGFKNGKNYVVKIVRKNDNKKGDDVIKSFTYKCDFKSFTEEQKTQIADLMVACSKRPDFLESSIMQNIV